MSELSLHCLGMRPLGDKKRGAGMPEVARSKVAARCLEGRLPHSLAEIASAQGLPLRGSEDERIVGGSGASRQVLGQLIPKKARDHHRSALVGLRGTEQKPLGSLGKRLDHMKPGTQQLTSSSSQGYRLAPSQPAYARVLTTTPYGSWMVARRRLWRVAVWGRRVVCSGPRLMLPS